MSIMDYLLVAVVVGGAAAYLAWRIRGFFAKPGGGSCCGGCPVAAPAKRPSRLP